LLLQYDMVLPNSSLAVATLYLGPMGSLWAYIEGMDVPCLLLRGQTVPIWRPAAGSDFTVKLKCALNLVLFFQ